MFRKAGGGEGTRHKLSLPDAARLSVYNRRYLLELSGCNESAKFILNVRHTCQVRSQTLNSLTMYFWRASDTIRGIIGAEIGVFWSDFVGYLTVVNVFK